MPKPSLCQSQKDLALAVFVPWPPFPLGFGSVKLLWLKNLQMALSQICSHASYKKTPKLSSVTRKMPADC